MVCTQAAGLLGMERGMGRPLESGKPTRHMLFAMANPSGSKDEVAGEIQSPLINWQMWWAPAVSLMLTPRLTANIRKRRNKPHRQSHKTGIVSTQSREGKRCPWEGDRVGGESGGSTHLAPLCTRGGAVGGMPRQEGP